MGVLHISLKKDSFVSGLFQEQAGQIMITFWEQSFEDAPSGSKKDDFHCPCRLLVFEVIVELRRGTWGWSRLKKSHKSCFSY
jgi:hypothetical protein